MARLAPVTKAIPGFKGHVPWIAFPCDSCGFPATYAVKIEPRVDSCDGVAGTFGWDPAVIQVGFLWAGTTQALVDLLGQRLDAGGWTRGNAPAWAEDGAGDVWNYPPGHAPVETLTLDPHSHGPWMVNLRRSQRESRSSATTRLRRGDPEHRPGGVIQAVMLGDRELPHTGTSAMLSSPPTTVAVITGSDIVDSVPVIRGSSDRSVLVLTSLSSGPKHGYALIKDIESFSGVSLGPGSLYGAIDKLEHAGLIEAMPGEGRRKPYRITARGAADLREQLVLSEKVFSVGLDRLAGAGGT